MKTISKALTKASVASVAAGAMALTSASPAMARDRDRGLDAGDIIAGAVILGGIAAVAASVGKKRHRDYRHHDRGHRYRDRGYRYDDRGYRRGGRNAVERCIYAAEKDARRYGYRFADVTEIRDVDHTRYGWRVKGRIVVDDSRRHGRWSDRHYYRGDRYNHRGYGKYRSSDRGKFTCHFSRGRVTDIDYSGIRGLR